MMQAQFMTNDEIMEIARKEVARLVDQKLTDFRLKHADIIDELANLPLTATMTGPQALKKLARDLRNVKVASS